MKSNKQGSLYRLIYAGTDSIHNLIFKSPIQELLRLKR